MIRYAAVIFCLLLSSTGCANVPCANAGALFAQGSIAVQGGLGRVTQQCAGLFSYRTPCVPRRYFSIYGYDAFWDRIVVRDAATCNARQAYRQFCRASGSRYAVDFRDGFCSAYLNYAEGFPAAMPPLPPEKYWSAHYRTPQGHARAADWFSGYEAGMASAQSDPLGDFNIVPAAAVLGAEGLRADDPGYFAAPTGPPLLPYGY